MVKYFLIVSLWMPGSAPMELENSPQPDLATCLGAAQHVLEQMVSGGHVTDRAGNQVPFQFAAGCNVRKEPGDPA